MGGFLGQVQRGRAQRSLKLRCGLVVAAVCLGSLVVGSVAGAQQMPTVSTVPSQQAPAGGRQGR